MFGHVLLFIPKPVAPRNNVDIVDNVTCLVSHALSKSKLFLCTISSMSKKNGKYEFPECKVYLCW